jgi:hypothetical protein
MQERRDQALDEQAVELIAARVTESLRQELLPLMMAPRQLEARPSLNVEQVAMLLGVARSTVYAHWREWGGYKLGRGRKAPIRFEASRLPAAAGGPTPDAQYRAPVPGKPSRRRPRRLIVDAPRLADVLDLSDS